MLAAEGGTLWPLHLAVRKQGSSFTESKYHYGAYFHIGIPSLGKGSLPSLVGKIATVRGAYEGLLVPVL